MKLKLIWSSFVCAVMAAGVAHADDSLVNLTPIPKEMSVTGGSYVLPTGMKVSIAGLPEDMAAEVTRFVADLNKATGLGAVTVSSGAADVNVAVANTIAPEGYTFEVTAGGVSVKAATATGLYYAFQTFKKVLPANVMAGVKEVADYALPLINVADEPRFDYRGFMLDVSRHFYTTDEVKRMLDVMAYYKMNRFHWHLTDDQGWRVEVPGYPKLTTIAATAPNCLITDMYAKSQYWTNRPYGPFFYTKEEMKDVVAYAKERHIEVIPEVEFLGHMAAVMTAYPEFSCNPAGSHEVWVSGGVSTDILNVANPAAIQFCKDVLTEVMDIFPSDVIHIGGDECPTTGWDNNADCQAMKTELGYTNMRGLQSYFNKQMSDFVKSEGRTLAMWNESVTAGGTDLNLMKQTNATIYCWYAGSDGGASVATSNGFRSIYTLFGPYYINRRQDPNDPPGAGGGENTVQQVYNHVPFSTVSAANQDKCYGVQGTFWCEQVSDREYMEYAALPRLIAIAEAGWTPQAKKNFNSFRQRITADRKLLDYGGYKYATHYMLDNGEGPGDDVVTPDPNEWYRLISRCTASPRAGACIELLTSDSDKIGTGNAQANRLWSHDPAKEGDSNYDYQWWSFVEDPANPGHYAMVCKAKPDGSVKSTPTAQNNTGRWDYDDSARHYDFTLDTSSYYGKDSESGAYYYAIRSTKQNDGYWMNMAAAGQNFSINCYNDPTDGNSGIFTFMPLHGVGQGDVELYPSFSTLEHGKTYSFINVTTDLEGITISDDAAGSSTLSTSFDDWANNAWEVVSVKTNANNTKTVRLRNAVTGRFIGSVGAYVARSGRPVTAVNSEGADVVVTCNESGTNDFTLAISGQAFWPNTATAPSSPLTLRAGNNANSALPALRAQGTAWSIEPVTVYTYVCTDDKGQDLGTRTRSLKAGAEAAKLCPEIKNHELVSASVNGTTVNAVYHRTATTITYICRDGLGAVAARVLVTGEAGSSYKVKAPTIEFYTLESISPAEGTTLTLDKDQVIEAVYSTEAINGVKAVGDAVSEVKDGMSYVLYDADPRGGGRNCFRFVNDLNQVWGTSTASMTSPAYAWVLEASGDNFKVKSLYNGLYIPAVHTSSASNPVVMNSTGEPFEFSYDLSVDAWRIKNSSNNLYWDGNSDGSLSGWSADKGQPVSIFEYEALPHFRVSITAVNLNGDVLQESVAYGVAGEEFTLVAPAIAGYSVKSVSGNEGFDRLTGHKSVTVTYEPSSSISAIAAGESAGSDMIFDLQGRRLNAISRPGIYIINGAKILVK